MEFLTRTLLCDEGLRSESLFTFKLVSVIQCLEMVTTPKGPEMLTSEKKVGAAQAAHCSAAHSAAHGPKGGTLGGLIAAGARHSVVLSRARHGRGVQHVQDRSAWGYDGMGLRAARPVHCIGSCTSRIGNLQELFMLCTRVVPLGECNMRQTTRD